MGTNEETSEAIYCLICGKELSRDNPLVTATLDDQSSIYAHERCAKGLSLLLEQIGGTHSSPKLLNGLVRNVQGKLILTKRNFPSQYIPILIFYSLHNEAPLEIDKLREWLTLNRLDFSNPLVPVKRLTKKGALAVMVGEDKTARYFLTDEGMDQLKEYLGQSGKKE